MSAVTPFLTFPNISWWMRVWDACPLILDSGEHFEKMTYRNRYRISGANNTILLSVPLVNGRNQHVPMKDLQIFNKEKWQVQHWRTLVSVYRRSPYFDYYEDSLKLLFETSFERLIDFNRAGIIWTMTQLKMNPEMHDAPVFLKTYPSDILDLRSEKLLKPEGEQFRKYYQVFEDRNGFIPNLSILDLLFSEGPGSVNWLKR